MELVTLSIQSYLYGTSQRAGALRFLSDTTLCKVGDSVEYKGTLADGLEMIIKPSTARTQFRVSIEPSSRKLRSLITDTNFGFTLERLQYTGRGQQIIMLYEELTGGSFRTLKFLPVSPDTIPLQSALPKAKVFSKPPVDDAAPDEHLTFTEVAKLGAYFAHWFSPETGWAPAINDKTAAQNTGVSLSKVTAYRRAVYPNSDMPEEVKELREVMDDLKLRFDNANARLEAVIARYSK